MLWFNYLASFSDGVQKVGVTSQPFYRLQDRLLEAARHGLRITAFDLTWPSASKQIAEGIKRHVCESFADQAMPGHYDWFVETPRMSVVLDDAFVEQNPKKFLIETASQYDAFCRFAKDLGWNGALIKPGTATTLAMELVQPHHQIYASPVAIAYEVKGMTKADSEKRWADYFSAQAAAVDARRTAVLA